MTALVAALLVSATGGAQTSSNTSSAAKRPVHRKHRVSKRVERRHVPVQSATERQLHDLKDEVSGQQAQIDSLKSMLTARDQQVVQAQQSVAEAQSQIASAAATTAQAAQQSTQNAQDVQQLKASVGDLSTQSTSLQQTVTANQEQVKQVQQAVNSPATLHYKGVTILPVGFAAFEGVWRQHSVNSDINTPFNSIPFPSAQEGHVSELNFSGRQSRLGALVTGDAGNFNLAGYIEADFLGTGTSSNNNQSDSYVLRQRQFWGQVTTASGLRVTGGQMWSLVTEDAHGTDNRTEVLPFTIDPQYMVGFSWTRQPGIRLQQRFGSPTGNGFTLAISAEQAQITNFTASATASAAVPANYFFAGPGQNGGLYNAAEGAGAGNAAGTSAITTYANNVAPDIFVKGAWDFPHAHLELGGYGRFLRDYYYPITGAPTTVSGTTSTTAYTYQQAPYVSNTAVAGGGYGAFRVSVVKALDLGVSAMAGQAAGRYGSTQLADATLKPTGALEPIKNYHGLFSVVTHEGKNLDIFAYYGGEYDQRTLYKITTGGFAGDTIGYGVRTLDDAGCYAQPTEANLGTASSGTGGSISSPSTCASPTKYMQEGTIGFTYRVVNSPRYGRLQYAASYSYLQRTLWSGAVTPAVTTAPAPTPTGPRAEDNMVHVSMRYYIP